MKTKNLSFLLMVILVLVGLVSCGDPETGPIGPAGTNGTNGEDGNSNVVTVLLDDVDVIWSEGLYLGRTSNVYEFMTSAVTQDIIDNGTITAEMRLFDETPWYPLPLMWENSTGTSRQFLTFTYDLGIITLYAFDTDGVLSPATSEFRFTLTTNSTVSRSVVSLDQVYNVSPVPLD